ncbi:hypothetical protein Y032_0007g3472 [Ancylostoma ceylanicum]|nr:hypothetical protein Y032_0007g3472 [Ancylostoma ceylanicum]
MVPIAAHVDVCSKMDSARLGRVVREVCDKACKAKRCKEGKCWLLRTGKTCACLACGKGKTYPLQALGGPMADLLLKMG